MVGSGLSVTTTTSILFFCGTSCICFFNVEAPQSMKLFFTSIKVSFSILILNLVLFSPTLLTHVSSIVFFPSVLSSPVVVPLHVTMLTLGPYSHGSTLIICKSCVGCELLFSYILAIKTGQSSITWSHCLQYL